MVEKGEGGGKGKLSDQLCSGGLTVWVYWFSLDKTVCSLCCA